MNKFHSFIIRLLCPDPVLFWAYALPVSYWIYLTLTTNFVFVFDSEAYFDLAHILYDPGQWVKYFINGPSREPFYPLVVAVSMHAGHWLGISYTYTLKALSFGLLAATMILIQQILKLLKANRWIQAGTILYTGFSPILINSALCLYSEIATFPWLVAEVWCSIYFLRSLREAPAKNLYPAMGVGLCLLGFTFVKGIGEGLSPLFFTWLLWYAWRCSGLKIIPFLRRSKFKILVLLFVFYIPLSSYKYLNYVYNGHFNLTNRAELVLYGVLVQRAQSPVTVDNTLIHLSTTPISYPLCSYYYPVDKCSYWTNDPDIFYRGTLNQLSNQNLSAAQMERIIHQGMWHTLFSHPFREFFNLLPEGLKMFFWETTRGPFVVYPDWLQNLFYNHSVVILTTLVDGCVCLIGFLAALTLLNNEIMLIIVVLTSLLIFIFSFCNIIGRWAIIAGPLMILLNASCLTLLSTKASEFFASKGRETR